MQHFFAAGIALTACLFPLTASAFAPDASGVAETALRPPSSAVAGRSTAPQSLIAGAAQDDGSVTFLGSESLPSLLWSVDVAGKDAHPALNYFKNKAGDGNVELLQTSEDGAADNTTVSFQQTLAGVPIVGTFALAQVSYGRVRYARHLLVTPPRISTRPAIGVEQAEADALADVRGFAQDGNVVKAPKLVVLYVLDVPTLVWQVGVTSQAPFASWEEFVDAQGGGVVGRHKASLDAVSGNVQAKAEPSCQGETPVNTPVPFVQWTPGRATNYNGQFSSSSALTQAEIKLNGAYFRINSGDRQNYTWRPTLQQSGTNNIELSSMPLGQIDPYVYLNQARMFLRNRAATMSMRNSRFNGWLAGQVQVNANLPSGYQGFSCNAFYDPSDASLNFYQDYAAWGCNNSGRSNKIVFHEYGHSIHHHLTANDSTFDAQMSEGISDYVMATITGDPNVTGLTGCNALLSSPGTSRPSRPTVRTCVNRYTFCNSRKCDAFPGDESHHSAPIMCGALWDLRNNLITEQGQTQGALTADQIFLRFLTVATDMSTAYTSAIAADDDADGDPSNGTDHSCAINKAFLGDANGFAHFPDQAAYRVPCVR